MLTPWKVAVVKFLREKDQKSFSKELTSFWSETHPDDKPQVYHFLYLAKQWQSFLLLFSQDIKDGIYNLPWAQFLRLIQENSLILPADQKKLMIKVLKHQKITIKADTPNEEILNAISLKKKYLFMQALQDRKQELLSSATIAKSEQLHEKHVFYLNQLKKLFPSDISIKQTIYEKEKMDAEQILIRARRSRRQSVRINKEDIDAENSLVHKISNQAQSILQQSKEKANDFFIMFRQLGANRLATDYLNDAAESPSKDWQLLESLLASGQHLALLSHCENLKFKYADKPDSLFSISYSEALAYWELGEQGKAIQLMGQIANMKPNYKSANELLSEWKEESLE